MELIKAIKWYHVVIVSLFIILIFFIITGTNCTKNICQNALKQEPFSSAQDQSHGIPDGKIGKYDCEIILYFVDWCPHCKNFLPEWDKFENYAKAKMQNVKVNKIRCEDGDEATCIQKGIKGYPTVMFYKDNKEIMYDGERKMESLVEYINKQLVKTNL